MSRKADKITRLNDGYYIVNDPDGYVLIKEELHDLYGPLGIYETLEQAIQACYEAQLRPCKTLEGDAIVARSDRIIDAIRAALGPDYLITETTPCVH